MAEFIVRKNGLSESSSTEGKIAAVRGAHEGLNPHLNEKRPLLLLLLEAEHEEIRQQEQRRLCVRMPPVIWE